MSIGREDWSKYREGNYGYVEALERVAEEARRVWAVVEAASEDDCSSDLGDALADLKRWTNDEDLSGAPWPEEADGPALLTAYEAWALRFSCPCGYGWRGHRRAIPEGGCPECGRRVRVYAIRRPPDDSAVVVRYGPRIAFPRRGPGGAEGEDGETRAGPERAREMASMEDE